MKHTEMIGVPHQLDIHYITSTVFQVNGVFNLFTKDKVWQDVL
jgi:hypothetical protein